MDYRKRCYSVYVSKHWDEFRSLSRAEYELVSKKFAGLFGRFLPKDRQGAILDIACGSGHFLYFLKKAGYTNIRGIDISGEQLDAARRMGVTEVEEADLFEFLPAHSEEFDMIAASDIIEHLKKDEVLRLLDSIYAATKRGGTVLISTLNCASLFGSAQRYIDFTHETGFTPLSLAQVMRVCGFEVEIFGEGPVAYDIRSAARKGLWWMVERLVRLFLLIECGAGRGLFKPDNRILNPKMFAVGKKPGP